MNNKRYVLPKLFILAYILVAAYLIRKLTQNESDCCNNYRETCGTGNGNKILDYSQQYDSKIKGIDQLRLGFALGPEFQVTPKNAQQMLKGLKKQLKLLLPFPMEGNIDSEIVKNIVKPVKILVFDSPWWANFQDCPEIQDPLFQCNFFNWSRETSNKSLEETILSHSDLDAIFIYRAFQYREAISLDSIFEILNSKKAGSLSLTIKNFPRLIYFTQESPGAPHGFQIQMRSKKFKKFSNLAPSQRPYFGSYWRGSDIYKPYFQWQYFNKSVKRKVQSRNYAKGRTKMAAIVVSNCHPNNNRLGFVKELQEFISVDIYGKCGDFECNEDECFADLNKNYKFYLAFENSNCRDYITEKLFYNAFMNDLLPIVLGAHPVDYKAIAPENSYIHVDDFESVEELGKYLKILDENDTQYNEYFTWKGTGKISQENFLCPVCTRLHADNLAKVSRSLKLPLPPVNQDQELLLYLNNKDSYNFDTFNWNTKDTRLCLQTNEWYWNKRL